MTLRFARAGLLFGFALLILKLFLTGEMVKYMSPTLDPLTALTGVLLAAMGAMELRAAAGRPGTGPHADDHGDQALTLLLLLLPLTLGFLLVPRALGAAALGGEDVAGLLLRIGPESRPVGATPPGQPIQDLPALLAYLRQHGGAGVGQRVQAIGLVVRSSALEPNELALLRYSIAHCVADARPLGLLVVAPSESGWPADQWVRVDGTLDTRQRDGDRLVTIIADTITPTGEPDDPYLTSR